MSLGPDPPTAGEAAESNLDTETLFSDTTATNSCPSSQIIPSNGHGPIWPPDCVPVELFSLIADRLSYKDIKTLRLVNREFEHKLAERYFRVVVVPFRSDFESIYRSLKRDADEANDGYPSLGAVEAAEKGPSPNGFPIRNLPAEARRDVSLLAGGYRVFQQFGDKIRKFALALELDETELAYPPHKITQRIVKTSWGLCRWPIKEYQRYSRLERLEKLADETPHLIKAFGHLDQITEIGISCDTGLGWLQGPDTNLFCSSNGPAVFKPSEYGDRASTDIDYHGSAPIERPEGPLALWILKQMALISGCSIDEWPRVVLRLLEDENCGGIIEWVKEKRPNGEMVYKRIPMLQVDESTTNEHIIQHIGSSSFSCDDYDKSCDMQVPALIPNSLTTAQAEMLLELGWAHLALMQSYRLAVLENKSSFKNLRQLTIARCPSDQLGIWCNDEFWGTMTSIDTLHLGVIPNWRKIHKDATGVVATESVAPIAACSEVFELLHDYVGEQPHVKNISFEWLCGGEFGIGKCQRDRWILPAPVFSQALLEPWVNRQLPDNQILNLPYVEKLSLKNCWFAPHIMTLFCKHVFKDALTELTLESVSLSGPHTTIPLPVIYPRSRALGPGEQQFYWPWPLCVGAEPGQVFQLVQSNIQAHIGWGNVAAVVAPMAELVVSPVLDPNIPAAPAEDDQQPQALSNANAHDWRLYSWPHVLASLGMASGAVKEHLDVGDPERRERHERAGSEIEESCKRLFGCALGHRERKKKSQTIRLKSCGYALVDTHAIDNWCLIPNHPMVVEHDGTQFTRLKDLDKHMMHPFQSHTMAKIINYIPNQEQQQLQEIFGLRFGWDDLYEDVVKTAAVEDGNPHPGRGRFHGKLNAST